jgi:hypothetical protein
MKDYLEGKRCHVWDDQQGRIMNAGRQEQHKQIILHWHEQLAFGLMIDINDDCNDGIMPFS